MYRISACWILFVGTTALAAEPAAVLERTRAAVERGDRAPGAELLDGYVVAVGRAEVANFGNRRRAGLRAEEKAELAAYGELRLWALAHQGGDPQALASKLSRPVPPEALRAYLATISGDEVEIRNVLAKDAFHDESQAFAILVVAPEGLGAGAIEPAAFESGLEKFLQTEPSVGEAAYELFAGRRSQAEPLLLRQLEAEGLPSAPFRQPYGQIDSLLASSNGAARQTALQLVRQARERLGAEDLPGARAGFLKALAAEPLSAEANAGLAEVYVARQMPNLALRFLERAFAGEGNRRELYELHARALRLAGREAEARLASGLAAQTAPGAPVSLWLVPHYYRLLAEKLPRAALLVRSDGFLPLAELRALWPRRHADAARWLEQGKSSFGRSKDTTEALALFYRALDADPFDAEALNYAAASLRAQKNFAGARVFAALAVSLDPAHVQAAVNLAMALEALGAHELALAELRRARGLGTTDAWSLRQIAEGLARLETASQGGKP
jgi:hypothetical protein